MEKKLLEVGDVVGWIEIDHSNPKLEGMEVIAKDSSNYINKGRLYKSNSRNIYLIGGIMGKSMKNPTHIIPLSQLLKLPTK